MVKAKLKNKTKSKTKSKVKSKVNKPNVENEFVTRVLGPTLDYDDVIMGKYNYYYK